MICFINPQTVIIRRISIIYNEAKFVYPIDNPNNAEYRAVERKKQLILGTRSILLHHWPGRSVDRESGKLGMFWNEIAEAERPSFKALSYHRTACLIWKVAGGVNPVEDESSSRESDDYAVNTQALKLFYGIK